MFALAVTSEAEERAKREAEEETQQDEAMDPQEAPGKLEQSDPNQDKVGEEEPESDTSGSPPDANTGEMEQGEQPAETSHKNPPLQNGMFCLCGLTGIVRRRGKTDLNMRCMHVCCCRMQFKHITQLLSPSRRAV